jgi:hypothetical protein
MVAGILVLPVVLSHCSRVLASSPGSRWRDTIQTTRTPNQVASDLFTTFHADTPDGERFLQALNGRRFPMFHLKNRRTFTLFTNGLTITQDENGNTVLSGHIVDQAALNGILNKTRDLGMTLISVTLIE